MWCFRRVKQCKVCQFMVKQIAKEKHWPDTAEQYDAVWPSPALQPRAASGELSRAVG